MPSAPDTADARPVQLILGGSGGIGSALCRRLAARGDRLVLAGSAAATYARRGLRVNVVAPGLVDTPLAAPITSREATRQASESMHPLGRLGRPDAVAAVLALLLDPANDWITGQVWGVDGGLARARAQG